MSLLEQMKEPCVRLIAPSAADGMGGHGGTWNVGTGFWAVIRRDKSPEAVEAQRQGAAEAFTVVVDRDVSLAYHEVFRRVSDGAVFRMTAATAEGRAPEMSGVPIAKGSAERWVIA